MNRIYPQNRNFLFIAMATAIPVRESFTTLQSFSTRSVLLYLSRVYYVYLDVNMCLIIIVVAVSAIASVGSSCRLAQSYNLHKSVHCKPFERQVQFGSWQRLLHWHDNKSNTGHELWLSTHPVNYQPAFLKFPPMANWRGYMPAALEASAPYCSLVVGPVAVLAQSVDAWW